MSTTPAFRSERARVAAFTKHARSDARQSTAAAREALIERYRKQVDPDAQLSEAECDRRARCAIGADLARARIKAAQSRTQNAIEQLADELLAATTGAR